MSRRKLVLFAVLFEGGLAGVALGLGWLCNQPPWPHLHWDATDFSLGVAATVPMLAGFFLCLRAAFRPLVRIKNLLYEIVGPLFRECSTAELALISILAGLGEEMLFRGVLQGLFTRWLTIWGGIVAVNILFGLLHMVTPAYAVVAGLAGFYLSGLYLWRENLLAVIVAHALFDLIALVYVVRRRVPLEPGNASSPMS